jgi:peptide/nickel transport system substrate-binding protein
MKGEEDLKDLWQRRSFLGLLLTLALTASACVGQGSPPTTTRPPIVSTTHSEEPGEPNGGASPAGKPYGGEAIMGNEQEPPTLNSFAPGGDNFIVALLGQAYWTGVQDIDGYTLEFIPEVVTELPTVANGGLTINEDGTETVRYTIRDEAMWADGVPISGDDFMFTYDTIVNPDLPIFRSIYVDILPESVVAGPKTFEYTLAAPTVQTELLFGTLIPKHDVEGTDFINDWNDTMWVSGGPFEFDQWQKGEFIRLTRNANYWKTDAVTGQQLPYLDSVIFRFIPETASLITAFKAREIDIVSPSPSIEAIEDLQSLEPAGAEVEVLSGPIWEHLNFQFGENRLLKNPGSYNEFIEYRHAVAHTIDRRKIVDEILKGQVRPLESYVEPFSPTLSQNAWAQYDYNPDKAIALLVELCARDDTDCDANPVTTVFSTTSNNDARVTLSQLFVEMFEDVGIIYEIQLEDSSLFFGETLDFGNWDLAEWAWVGSPGFSGLVAINDIFDPGGAPPGGQNFYRWGTPAVDGQDPEGFNQGESAVIDEFTARFAELRDELNATVDERELVALINEAEGLIADQAVIIPLYGRLDPGAVWADELGGYKHNPSQAGDTWNVEEWYRVDLG